jgi:glycosyltransferase involved in cell wall biosynthesis
MSKTRIALDFSGLDSLGPACGQYRYVVDLVRGLSRLGADADFLLLGSRAEPAPELSAVFREHGDRWAYLRIRRPRFRGSDYFAHARYGWLLRRERVSLLHALHTFVPLLAPCPVVVTKYDLMYELFDDYKEARRTRPYRIYKWSVRNAVRRVVCISDTTAADLEKLWGVGRDRIDVILLGSDLAAGDEAPRGGQDPARDDGGAPFVLLSPYNLEPRKNLDALLEAAALLRRKYTDLKLVLFGRAAVTPEREERFLRRVGELGIEDGVTRTGLLADAELAALYRAATLFVFPSLYEGFGLPLLEAMNAGACVVARGASAMAEVLGGEAGALAETRDPRALASTIEGLLDDAEARRALGRRARERAATFGTDRMARLTYECYLKALAGGR